MERITPYRTALAREGLLRDLAVDGRRYCVAELGEGPPLLLLHGLGGSLYDWRHLLRPLAASRRVVAVDLLGAGESDKPRGEDYSVAAQARRVRGLMRALDIGRADVAGSSYGGGVALRLAQDWPEAVRRLVLLNSICYPERLPAYVPVCFAPGAAWVAEVVPLGGLTLEVIRRRYQTVRALTPEEETHYVAEIGAPGTRAAAVRWVRDALRPSPLEFVERLRSVESPALLVWGRRDATIPVELGRRLAVDLPRASLVEVDAGHVPGQERPAEVLSLMEGFLEEAPGDGLSPSCPAGSGYDLGMPEVARQGRLSRDRTEKLPGSFSSGVGWRNGP